MKKHNCPPGKKVMKKNTCPPGKLRCPAAPENAQAMKITVWGSREFVKDFAIVDAVSGVMAADGCPAVHQLTKTTVKTSEAQYAANIYLTTNQVAEGTTSTIRLTVFGESLSPDSLPYSNSFSIGVTFFGGQWQFTSFDPIEGAEFAPNGITACANGYLWSRDQFVMNIVKGQAPCYFPDASTKPIKN